MTRWIVAAIIMCSGLVYGGEKVDVNGGFGNPTKGMPAKWIMNKGLPGEVKLSKDGDQNAVEVISDAKPVHIYSGSKIDAVAGDKVTLSVKAKGTGKAILGLYMYSNSGRWIGKNVIKQFDATPEWKKETFVFELDNHKDKTLGHVRVVFGVQKKSTVSFADVAVETTGSKTSASATPAFQEIEKKPLGLTLPKTFYGVTGIESAIYLENIILAQNVSDYELKVEPAIGTAKPECWSIVPTSAQQGEKALTVSVVDKSKKNTVVKGDITLNIAPKTAGEGKQLTMLIIGDSLTGASQYPRELGRLLSEKGNPTWDMLGSNKVGKGVFHEGYGGWTWSAFLTKYVAGPKPKRAARGTSPFVFLGKDGKPGLDVERYFKEKCNGKTPNVITIMLGINDCFGLAKKLDNPAAVDKGISGVLARGDKMIKALQQAAPKAIFGICLTTTPNIRQEAFFANYKGKYNRWPWRQVQHRLVQRQINHFSNREKEGIYIIPTELNIDTDTGYPKLNGVHPNKKGYNQIAASIYSWVKWQFYKNRVQQD